MNEIEVQQNIIISDFLELGDSFDQYAYLIELGCSFIAMKEEEKEDSRLVDGCQSRVWLNMKADNGLFYFTADSDTLIIKGVLYLLCRLLCGQPLKAVAETELSFLHKTAIMETFSNDRRKGMGYIIKKLQTFARENSSSD